jgi:signal transduction histidine kinase
MNIRTTLTIRFVFIVILINIISSVSIFYLSAKYRVDDFYLRLFIKASNTAKLLLEVEEIDAGLLKKIEKTTQIRLHNEKIIIYDNFNQEIFSTDEDDIIHIDTALLEKIKQKRNFRFRQQEYEGLGFLLDDKDNSFIVIVAAIDYYGNRKIKNLQLVLVVVFFISIVLSLIFGWVYSGRALQPISAIIERVNKISIGSLDLRLDEGNKTDEIAKLSGTFNGMLDRIESAVKVQKNFIGNASHELRTPLTAMTGQLEVTLMNDRKNEEYKKILTSLLDDIRELNNISNRLLVLAQVDSPNTDAHFKPLRIDELIWQSRQELLKLYPQFNITVSISENFQDEKIFIINGNEQLLKIALSNIIENGCKYSPDKRTDIYITHQNEILTIQFTDNGIGIPEEDLPHVFEPFHRAKNTHAYKGSGIGLSLVKSILNMHNAEINMNSKVNFGTIVTIIFPKKQFF